MFKDGSSDVVISTLKDRALIALQGTCSTFIMWQLNTQVK